MKTLLTRGIGWGGSLLLLALFSLPVQAQESPVLRVDITQIDVDIDNDDALPPDPDDATFAVPNESFGPANTRVFITAAAEGTFTEESFTYTFYVNGVTIGSNDPPVPDPVTASWIPPRPGVYYLTVDATDGVTTVTSPTIRYYATGAYISSPLPGTLVPVGSSVTIKADATPEQGSIAQIEFFVDGVSVGTDSTAPYSVNYTPTAADGDTLDIHVEATPSSGATLTSVGTPVQIQMVAAVGNPPTVTVAAPADGAIIAVPSEPIEITITANDSDGRIERVETYVDGVLFATDLTFPYEADWTPVAVGQYLISALAYDDKNNVVASPVNTITISAPPAVSISSPSNGVAVSAGSPVTINATASDSDGTVTSVQFYAGGVFIGEDFTAPYSATWTPGEPDPEDPTAGLTALARDDLGLSTISDAVSVTVQGSGGTGGGGTVVGDPPTVSVTAPSSGATHTVNTPVLVSATAADTDGNVTKVQFYANSVLIGTDDVYPYSVEWTPTSVAAYALEARVTDNDGNLVASAPVSLNVNDPSGGLPSVSIVSPSAGQSMIAGFTASIIAAASDPDGQIASVQFFVDGRPQGGIDTTEPFLVQWTPTASGTYNLTAVAVDGSGNQATSSSVSVSVVANGAPSVTLTTPSSGTSVQQGTPVTLAANAVDADGTIASVVFLVNGIQIGTAATAPYSVAWTPPASGSYSIVARAIDNSGNQTDSTAVSVTAQGNGAPSVALTFPSNGATVVLGNTITLKADASDTNGAIAGVEFTANGTLIGLRDLAGPFEVAWTPTSAGIYRLQATATDNGGLLATSQTLTVAVLDTDEADTLYNGIYLAGTEQGNFVMAKQGDRGVTFIGYSTPLTTGGESVIYFYTGASVDATGNFSLTEGGATVLDGDTFDAGVFGNFAAGSNSATFSGTIQVGGSSTYSGPTGVVYGSLSGVGDSMLIALIGADASISVYARSGGSEDVGKPGGLSSDGSFTLSTVKGGTITGRIDPETGFLSGSISGSVSGSLSGAVSSAAPAADGFLRNLSTRGRVGTGESIMVAGFVVNGSGSRQVLVRAIGPTLADFGVSGVVTDPTMKLYRGETVIATNDDWGTDPNVPGATSTVGAFALPSGSRDAALVATLTPGPYTVEIAGVAGATGVGLVEIYDVNQQTAFSAEKVLNVSTRGSVGAGEQALIAGVIINGTTSKRVLIRAVGPTLSQFGLTGALADPKLTLVRQSNGATVRENDDWGMGNDVNDVMESAAEVGAFALPSGSKDAVLLVTLPPGAYTAVVESANGQTGVAIVEVYEVP